MTEKRCSRCKNMYENRGGLISLCPECLEIENKEYEIVREYIKTHPNVSMYELSRALSVPHSRILQYLKDERIEVRDLSRSFLRCDKCGATITTGIRCEACKRRYGYGKGN